MIRACRTVFFYLGLVAAWLPTGRCPATAEIAEGRVFHDRNGNGRRDPGEEGLSGVRVSNQREVVVTDADGRWRLGLEDEETVFFVIKPRGWMTPVDPVTKLPRFSYIHRPSGSPRLKYPGIRPTGPLPSSIDFPLRPQAEPDRFRVVVFADPQAGNPTEIDYLARDVVAELVGTDAAFGITLGDIVNNDLSLYPLHNETVGLIGIPWYNVIGNHDSNTDAPDDRSADDTFEQTYGPNYYAFEYGPAHFIALDDILWTGKTSPRGSSYRAALDARQLEFIRNDLRGVPRDCPVILLMHIPLTELKDREALFRLIEDRPHTLSLAGHTHSQEHRFFTCEDGWRGAEPHHHVINVTVCGSHWGGAPDECGIPHATMKDGTPNGYTVLTVDGHRMSVEFKAARRPASYQMNIYAPSVVAAAEAGDTEVLVNVFGGSDRSKVEMSVGPEGRWRPMRGTETLDPSIVQLNALYEGPRPPPGKAPRKASVCAHIWSLKLPAGLPAGLHLLRVRTTDMYGNTYQACRALRIR